MKGTIAMNSHNHQSAFGQIIYCYSRAQALADGVQIDVSQVAVEAGIRFPVFLTRTVYEAYVTVPPGVACQDEPGRLWDILWLLRFAIRKARSDKAACPSRCTFATIIAPQNS